MNEVVPVPMPLEEDSLTASRRERAKLLRRCTPKERKLLSALPEHRYQVYGAGKGIGLSARSVQKMLRRPRFKEALDFLLRESFEQCGVSHISVIADCLEIKNRCMQAVPVVDRKGQPVLTELPDGTLATAWTFDARGALAAQELLVKLLNLAPSARLELTGKNGAPLPAANGPVYIIAQEEAKQIAQDLDRRI